MNFNTVRHQSILKRVVIVERDIGGYIGGIFEVSDTYATRQEVQQDINEGYIDYTDFL